MGFEGWFITIVIVCGALAWFGQWNRQREHEARGGKGLAPPAVVATSGCCCAIPALIAPLLVLLIGAALAVEPVGELVPVEYVRTIDGDTIVVEIEGLPAGMDRERHVRLLAIDAPEIRDGTADAFAAALFAAERLKNAGGIWLEYDEEGGRDSFGRELAWVWYLPGGAGGSARDPVLLNLELVQAGHAWLYEGETSSRYADLLQAAERYFEDGSGRP